jgi:non-ribosomal peptide synthetase component E (peptide arylation enzyme)
VVVGRLKDIIIRGGENISPKLIEDVLLEHPSIAGIGVVGYPDPLYGERVCAVVATTDAAFGFTTMIDYLKDRGLAPYQLPEKLIVRAELPYTLTGKLDKSALRAEAAAP